MTKSKRACRIVKPDLSTAGDKDPSFEIECCDGSDVASPRTMKYRVVKKHWTFNTSNVVCKLVRADLDSAGNDDPLFVVQEWVKEAGDKGDNNDEDDGEDEHSGCEEVKDEEGGHCDLFSAIDDDLSTESEPAAEPEPEEEAVDFLRKVGLYSSFSNLGIADKGADTHRALCVIGCQRDWLTPPRKFLKHLVRCVPRSHLVMGWSSAGMLPSRKILDSPRQS